MKRGPCGTIFYNKLTQKMKYKVVLATLPGCKSCQALKDALANEGIKFLDVSCDKDPKLCDQLENITQSSKYPIAVLKDFTQNLDYIYYTSFDYNELGKERQIDGKVRAIGFFSPEEIIKKINSL